MDISEAAKVLSKKGVQIRTRIRNAVCLACGTTFVTQSAKARFCSGFCFTRVWKLRGQSELYLNLGKIHEQVDALIGKNPRINPTLKKISKLCILAKTELQTHLITKMVDD